LRKFVASAWTHRGRLKMLWNSKGSRASRERRRHQDTIASPTSTDAMAERRSRDAAFGYIGSPLSAVAPWREILELQPRTRKVEPFRLGRFIVLEKLGGSVYRAFDDVLDRPVALKLMHPGGDPRHKKRMRREAQALARLSHPNVVHAYQVGEVNDQLFIAMELIRGETLDVWQRASRSWRQCLHAYIQAGRGLAAAHAAAMVHRDFKPNNCIMDEDGRVRVVDFSLARHVESNTAKHSDGEYRSCLLGAALTDSNAVRGTPAYMAPEHMRGLETDARADQYSFCVSLYEALFGERPRRNGKSARAASSSASLLMRRNLVPGWLVQVLERGLQSSPDDRWPSMEAMLAVLEWHLRRRYLGWGSAIALALGLGLGAVAGMSPLEASIPTLSPAVGDGAAEAAEAVAPRVVASPALRPRALVPASSTEQIPLAIDDLYEPISSTPAASSMSGSSEPPLLCTFEPEQPVEE